MGAVKSDMHHPCFWRGSRGKYAQQVTCHSHDDRGNIAVAGLLVQLVHLKRNSCSHSATVRRRRKRYQAMGRSGKPPPRKKLKADENVAAGNKEVGIWSNRAELPPCLSQ